MSAAWKSAERSVAKALGGARTLRGADFGKSLPDIDHPLFSVEVKYRARLPFLLRRGLEQAAQYDTQKPPLLVLKQKQQRGAYVVMHLADFMGLFGPLQMRGGDAA
jgi:hypothetical protein